jgi:Family of unknown function (DUF5691)
MQSNEIFKEIANTALVGTERKKFSPSALDGELGATFTKLDSSNPEKVLQQAAGILAVYNLAGKLPPSTAGALPEPCDLDDLPLISLKSSWHLDRLMIGKNQDLLEEWLLKVAKLNKRVPASHLILLLDYGRQNTAKRELVMPVLGKRGLWLAKQNQTWNYATGYEEVIDWETAGRAERLVYLARLRKKEPAQARELLQTAWKQEKAADRAALLKTFEMNLSLDDEPFLETALDDRSSEVNKVAADLLADLPESSLCQRMLERLIPSVIFRVDDTLDLNLNRMTELEKNKEYLRDKIEFSEYIFYNYSGRRKISDKEQTFIKLLSCVKPSKWSDLIRRPPEKLLMAALNGDYFQPLMFGWIKATLRFKDVEWARAILNFRYGEGKSAKFQLEDHENQLIFCLPKEEQETFIAKILETETKNFSRIHEIVEEIASGWSLDFSRQILSFVIEKILAGSSQPVYLLSGILESLIAKMPFEFCDEIINTLTSQGLQEKLNSSNAKNRPNYEAEIESVVSLAKFRQEILKEILRDSKGA